MTFDSWNSLETAEQISVMFPHCELENPHRACSNLQTIAQLKIPFDLMQAMVHQLSEILPGISDPDMALNNLERFFAASRNALGLAALIQRDQARLERLLKQIERDAVTARTARIGLYLVPAGTQTVDRDNSDV